MSGRAKRAPGLLLVLLGCGHQPAPVPASDVASVTELAARYALEHDVPAVLREASPICLRVDGASPPPEVVAHLSQGPWHVSSGHAACTGPRAVLLEVSSVSVSGQSATAEAGVRLGARSLLAFRQVNGQWRTVSVQTQGSVGPVLTLPALP